MFLGIFLVTLFFVLPYKYKPFLPTINTYLIKGRNRMSRGLLTPTTCGPLFLPEAKDNARVPLFSNGWASLSLNNIVRSWEIDPCFNTR